MIQIPQHLFSQYRAYCSDNSINDTELADYQKWLRYFLDYSEKYQVMGDDAERTTLFLGKLRQKGQSEEKRLQAGKALSYYFSMLRAGVDRQPTIQQSSREPDSGKIPDSPWRPTSSIAATESFYNIAGYQEKSESPEWDEVMARLADEIKVRHYSRKTLKTYAQWSRQFQRFLKNKPPTELTGEDVKAYDIRVIQSLLGHGSLKTTMIYTHCVPVRTVNEARSPLDLDRGNSLS